MNKFLSIVIFSLLACPVFADHFRCEYDQENISTIIDIASDGIQQEFAQGFFFKRPHRFKHQFDRNRNREKFLGRRFDRRLHYQLREKIQHLQENTYDDHETGKRYFNSSWSHYINCGKIAHDPHERYLHIKQCPACNRITRDLASGLTIRIRGKWRNLDFPNWERPFEYVQLKGGVWCSVDWQGNVSYNNQQVGQLFYEDNHWWVNDGPLWAKVLGQK